MPAYLSPADRRKTRDEERTVRAEDLLARLLDKTKGRPLPAARRDDPPWYREARKRVEAKLREAFGADAAAAGRARRG